VNTRHYVTENRADGSQFSGISTSPKPMSQDHCSIGLHLEASLRHHLQPYFHSFRCGIPAAPTNPKTRPPKGSRIRKSIASSPIHSIPLSYGGAEKHLRQNYVCLKSRHRRPQNPRHPSNYSVVKLLLRPLRQNYVCLKSHHHRRLQNHVSASPIFSSHKN